MRVIYILVSRRWLLEKPRSIFFLAQKEIRSHTPPRSLVKNAVRTRRWYSYVHIIHFNSWPWLFAFCAVIGNLDGGPTTLLQITKYVQPTRDGEFEQWRVTYADGTHEDMDSFEVCVHT